MILAFLALISLYYVNAAPLEDIIKSLPGWSPLPLPSKQYSGFLDSLTDATFGTFRLHYWFVEAEVNPETAPLLLWFNGGPGASSLYGLLVELGPFLLSDLSLKGIEYENTGIPQLLYNPSGWQKAANILAISMPPPVGFSYCTSVGPSSSGSDCGSWNDTSTAEVTYGAINSWFKKFPEYKQNDMFISGESYAGVYVPKIVQQVLAHPEDGINLKGFAVGDACTPPDICGDKQVGPYWSIEFLYGKNAFSNKLYEEIHGVCTEDELIHGGLSSTCQTSVDKVSAEVGGYWAYAYYDDCWYENDIRRRMDIALTGLNGEATTSRRVYYGPPLSRGYRSGFESVDRFVNIPNGYACGGPAAQVEWLMLDMVKEALNVPADAVFFQSDNGVGFVYEQTERDLVSWYKDIIAENKLKVLVYNGDTDPCINAFQAQNWTRELGFAETEPWRPWTTDSCQRMGGSVVRYENNFDFLTIRGSGHMVPQFKPQASLEFITQFLQGAEYKRYNAECTAPEDSSPNQFMADENVIRSLLKKADIEFEASQAALKKRLGEIESMKQSK